jgi:hypothetical protein
MFAIYGSPAWANGMSESVSEFYVYVPTDSGAFTTWTARYKVFVSDLVNRYKTHVKKWELWNEPNEHYFWKPFPNVDRYAMWYQEMYKAIKAADPTAEVAIGGLAGLGASGPGEYDGNTFLKELYKRGVYPDNISIHPYGGDPSVHVQYENNFDDIGLIYETMRSYNQSFRPVWVTEWGWATNAVSEAVQADWVQRSLDMIRTRYPFVTVATYFLDYDRSPFYFGLYTSDFRLKPAGSRFKAFVESLGQVPPATVVVSISPTTAVAGPGQQVAFGTTVTGTTNTGVGWSISPAVGSISGQGVYSAPSAITSSSTVTVTAISMADGTKRAQAAVTLQPGSAVGVLPSAATLQAGQVQQFTATVNNASNTAVVWSMSPSVGSLSSSGRYTAPSTVLSPTTVVIRATSMADPARFASANVTLAASAPSSPPSTGELVGRWTLDDAGGLTAADTSGNGNTAILVNGAGWSAGKKGTGVFLDGTNDYLVVPDSASVRGNDFTLAVWVKSTNNTGYRVMISKPTG